MPRIKLVTAKIQKTMSKSITARGGEDNNYLKSNYGLEMRNPLSFGVILHDDIMALDPIKYEKEPFWIIVLWVIKRIALSALILVITLALCAGAAALFTDRVDDVLLGILLAEFIIVGFMLIGFTWDD